MMAITLHPEWAAAIVHAGKRVENRSWRHNRPGERVVIHAGASIGGGSRKTALSKWRRLAPLSWALDPDSRSLVHYPGAVDAPASRPIVCSAFVATAVLGEEYPAEGGPWEATEGWCRPLLDVRVIEPVPYRVGRLGFWRIPGEIAKQLEVS